MLWGNASRISLPGGVISARYAFGGEYPTHFVGQRQVQGVYKSNSAISFAKSDKTVLNSR